MHEPSSRIVRSEPFYGSRQSDIQILNDLVSLDHVTNDNDAFSNIANVLNDLATNSIEKYCGKHLQLPDDFYILPYWQQFISNAGDAHHPTETYTFPSYELKQNNRFGSPTDALHQFGLCLPLHVIFTLLSSAPCECCPKSTPFHVEHHTEIPHHLQAYVLSSFRRVVGNIEYIRREKQITHGPVARQDSRIQK